MKFYSSNLSARLGLVSGRDSELQAFLPDATMRGVTPVETSPSVDRLSAGEDGPVSQNAVTEEREVEVEGSPGSRDHLVDGWSPQGLERPEIECGGGQASREDYDSRAASRVRSHSSRNGLSQTGIPVGPRLDARSVGAASKQEVEQQSQHHRRGETEQTSARSKSNRHEVSFETAFSASVMPSVAFIFPSSFRSCDDSFPRTKRLLCAWRSTRHARTDR